MSTTSEERFDILALAQRLIRRANAYEIAYGDHCLMKSAAEALDRLLKECKP